MNGSVSLNVAETKVTNHINSVEAAMSNITDICREKGLRLTPLRRRILELILQQHNPIGAYELMDSLRGDGRRADPPTIYRTLDFLITNGLAHRIQSLNAYVGCQNPRNPHSAQFFICQNCSKTAELEQNDINEVLERHARDFNFEVKDMILEVTGICSKCRELIPTKGV